MNKENGYLSTIQWFIFLLANSIALPIVIGNVYHLSEIEISTFMQRMFLVVGLSSFLQAKFGHRYPIADGPAGSWVSIFIIYASVGIQQGNTMVETLQTIGAGIMVSGTFLLFLGTTKSVRFLLFLFSPIVSGTFLFILAIQLSGVFINGMFLTNVNTGKIDGISLLLSIFVFFLILILSNKGKGLIKNYAILIGILIGWIFNLILGKSELVISNSMAIIKLPEIFPWGIPHLNVSILVTAFLFTILLISNTVAAITATGEAYSDQQQFKERLNRGTWIGGISHFISALFSTIPAVPLPATAGFIKLTKQYRVFPFLAGCGIIMTISLFPSIVGLLASLPLPIASAALLATLIEMFAIAIRSLTKQPLNERNITIIGVSLLLGIGTLFLNPNVLNGLPITIQILGKNGLLVGTFVAIILEKVWKISTSEK